MQLSWLMATVSRQVREALPAQNYPSQLAGKLQRTVINAGVPGEINTNGLKRLPALPDKHEPTILVKLNVSCCGIRPIRF